MPRYIDPSLLVGSTPALPGVVASQEEADALRSVYGQQHPFMPSSGYTEPTVVPPTPSTRDIGRTAALASVLAQEGQTPAHLGGGWGRPAGDDIEAGRGGWGVPRRRTMASSGQLASTLSAQSAAAPSVPGGTMGSLLQAADDLRAAKIAGERRDVLNQFVAAGAMPSESDAPEARLVKQNYLRSRLGQELALASGLTNEAPRAPGTPVYLGTRKPGDNSIVPGAGPDIPREIGTPLPSNSQWAYLTDLAAKAAQEERVRLANPRLVTAGLDASGRPVQAMVDRNGNSKLLEQQKPIMQQVQVGGKTLFVGPGDRYFDEQGKPIDFTSEKPLSATEWVMLNNDPKAYGDYRIKFGQAMGQQSASAPAANAVPVPAAGPNAPKAIATQAEFAALPSGTRFTYNGKIGVKK